jgi:5-methylcytosine-specific restriction endonuclease McrA
MDLECESYLAQARFERELLSAEIVHKVNARDNCRCKARLPDGTICNSGFWTQIHHIIEVKDGGTNDLENLITLCGNHHRQWHAGQGMVKD